MSSPQPESEVGPDIEQAKVGAPGSRKRAPGGGRKPSFDEAGGLQLVELLRSHPTATLDELVDLARQEMGVTVGRQTLVKTLNRHGVSKRQVRREWVAPGAADVGPKPTKRYGYLDRHRREMQDGRYPSSVTDAEWGLVQDLFAHHGGGKRPVADRRVMLDAVLYVVRSGASWRMLPAEFPDWNNVYATFRRWVRDGVMETMYDRLRAMMRERAGRPVEPTAGVLDSQSTRISPQGGPKGYDGGKKITGRKRHLLVDTLGLLLAVFVSTANVQDRDAAGPILAKAKAKHPTLTKTFVDAGYCGSKTAAAAAKHGVTLQVVKRPQFGNREWVTAGMLPLFPEIAAQAAPFPILPKRWVVERNNAWSERPRRMNRDHDCLLSVSEAWIWLVQGRMLLAQIADVA